MARFGVAQQPAAPRGLRRVGILAPSTREREEVTLKPFFDQMKALGWIEGQTVAYDRAYAGDQHTAMPKLAAELVARAPDVIYAPPAPAAGVARQATKTIPIVFGTSVDPIGSGLVASLSRPGGNVTGISSIADSLAPKRVQLLREILPKVERIGLLGDPGDPTLRIEHAALASLAPSLGVTTVNAPAANPAEFDAAVNRLLGEKVDAILMESAFAFNMRFRLFELLAGRPIPVVGHRAQMADAGALFAYGASLSEQLRRSALLVDKILRGARPAETPVELPDKFELVVNLKAARALGIAVPSSVVLRADRVIE
jgi:putative ABC transport system substrate-binding protein